MNSQNNTCRKTCINCYLPNVKTGTCGYCRANVCQECCRPDFNDADSCCSNDAFDWCCNECFEEEFDEEDEFEEEEENTEMNTETKDYIGNYTGDIYGCCDGECKRCVNCNPLLWWLNRRPIKRPDMALKACAEIKKYDNKRSNAYINGFNDGFIDEDYNLIKSKLFCENGNCNGGRAFSLVGGVKSFCCPCCLNKGLNLKPTDEDYWTDEYCECDDCKKKRTDI